MLKSEISSVNERLGDLLARVSPEVADTLRACRRVLQSAAELAGELEENLVVDVAASGEGAA